MSFSRVIAGPQGVVTFENPIVLNSISIVVNTCSIEIRRMYGPNMSRSYSSYTIAHWKSKEIYYSDFSAVTKQFAQQWISGDKVIDLTDTIKACISSNLDTDFEKETEYEKRPRQPSFEMFRPEESDSEGNSEKALQLKEYLQTQS